MQEAIESLSPEYIHVILNPLPVYGLGIGILLLAIAMMRRLSQVQIAGLFIIAISSLSAWPVAQFGHKAHARLESKLSVESNQWLQYHEQTGNTAATVAVVCAVAALAALTLPRKFPKSTFPLAILALFAAIVSFAASSWASKAGGQVQHEEFRTGAAPPPSADAHHHETEGSSQRQPESAEEKPHAH